MTLYELVSRLRKRPPVLCAQDTRPNKEDSEAIQRSIEASKSVREAVIRTMEAFQERAKQ